MLVVHEPAHERRHWLGISLSGMPAQHGLLFVHAHPDDECINNGATMAKYVAEGRPVTLVTCTRGEEGEVLVPALEHLAAHASDGLGAHRETELAEAMAVLGVTDYRFLGGAGRYRDSGMMGVPSNERPDCFWQADVDEAATYLVEVIREVRPLVTATYDDNGGYGHPDHIQTHRVTVRAVELAAQEGFRPDLGPAWRVPKVYEAVMPRSFVQQGIEAMRLAGLDFFGTDDVDDLPFVQADERVTARIDATDHEPQKMRALKAHATQVEVDGPFFALSDHVGQRAWGYEFYHLRDGAPAGPYDESGWETSLLNGLPDDAPA
jgi:N-acetyl-1-D-myo-inositol-2-amino-2-deoxy-alpha-D-glucopyranoside deacetylase